MKIGGSVVMFFGTLEFLLMADFQSSMLGLLFANFSIDVPNSNSCISQLKNDFPHQLPSEMHNACRA